jgi:DNA polymerase I-like protein with 3'-5' exonuclease and polymerase domains
MIVIEEAVTGKHPVTINVLESGADIEQLKDFVRLHGGEVLGLDTETTGLNVYAKDFRIRLLQLGTDRESFVIPLDSDEFHSTARWVLDAVDSFVLHNAKFDLQVIERTLGIPMDDMWGKVTDTVHLAHLVESRVKKEGGIDKKLEALVAYYISPEDAERIKGSINPLLTKKYGATLATIWKKVDQFDPDYLRYSGMDPVWARMLYDILNPLVPATSRGLIKFEAEVARVAAKMEQTGFLLDVEYTERFRDQLRLDESLAKEKAASFGVEKVGSTDNVADALESFGITITGRTDGGTKRKVDDALLKQVVAGGGPAGELAQAVIDAKRFGKAATAWAGNFLKERDQYDRVHPSINTLQARTGRMSISNPATQQLPSDRWEVRRCFLADEGHKIASVDYSSQELRVLAALSGDRTMATALLRGDNLHLLTARAAFGPGIQKTDPEYKYGKTTNFSKVYGGGANSIAEKYGLSFPVAKKIVDAFDATYKEVPVFSKILQQEATKTGHIVTPTGRRLAVDADRAYSALNYVIQSTSRDVTASALLRLDDAGFTPYLRLPIHDEVLASVPAEHAEWGAKEIGRIMHHDMPIKGGGNMPITTDPEVGLRSWGSLYGADY